MFKTQKFLATIICLLTIASYSQRSKNCSTIELVYNGNFSLGNTGFTSQLPFGNFCNFNSYIVNVNFNTKCPQWPNVTDHTGGANPNFLIIDGIPSGTVPIAVWQQTVNVCANTTYTFSFWTNSIYSEPFTLDMKIVESGLILNFPFVTGNIPQGAWAYHQYVWTATSNGPATISISQNTAAHKRDFGIDDVSFRYCCAPSSVNSSTQVCEGGNAILSAGGSSQYTWSPGGMTSPTISVSPSVTTVYTLTTAGSCGCSSLTTTEVTVVVTPTTGYSPDFTISPALIPGTNNFQITATPINTPSGFWWELTEVSPNLPHNVIPNTTMTNAQTWMNSPFVAANTFPGYNANSPNNTSWPASSPIPTPPYGLGNTPAAGIFDLSRAFRVTRGTWGTCKAWSTVSKIVYFNTTTGVFVIEESSYNPEMPGGLTTSIDDPLKAESTYVSIWPNPNNGSFEIFTGNETPKDISIYDISGKKVHSATNPTPHKTLMDVSYLPKGLYILIVENEGRITSRKFVIE